MNAWDRINKKKQPSRSPISARSSRFEEHFHVAVPISFSETSEPGSEPRVPNHRPSDYSRVRPSSAPVNVPGIGKGNLSLLQHFSTSMDDNLLRRIADAQAARELARVTTAGADAEVEGPEARQEGTDANAKGSGTSPPSVLMRAEQAEQGATARRSGSSNQSSTLLPFPAFDSSVSATTAVCTTPPPAQQEAQQDEFILGIENVAQVPDTDSGEARASTPSHLQQFNDIEDLITQPERKTGIARLLSWTRRKTRKARGPRA